MTADLMSGAIDTIERSLHGPRRVRADLVREVRDGLEDAVGGYREAGLDDDEAQRRALADFGDLRDVAAGLQEELAAGYGRRVAARMAVAFPSLVLLWDLLWVTGAKPDGPPLTPLLSWLASMIDGLALASAAACGLALVLLWSGARRGLPVARVTRGIGLLGLCTLVTVGGASLLLNFLNTGKDTAWYFAPSALGVSTATLCVCVWVGVSGRRCLRLGRPSGATRAWRRSAWG